MFHALPPLSPLISGLPLAAAVRPMFRGDMLRLTPTNLRAGTSESLERQQNGASATAHVKAFGWLLDGFGGLPLRLLTQESTRQEPCRKADVTMDAQLIVCRN